VYIFCGVSKSKIIDDFYMFLKIRSAWQTVLPINRGTVGIQQIAAART
jgi:hypothetical protein